MGDGVRVDDGFESGMDIPIYYDPMIAKLITYAPTRIAAIEKMKKAIADYEIVGPQTTLPFGEFVMNHEAFISGNIDTHFVKKHFTKEAIDKGNVEERKVAAAVALKIYLEHKAKLKENKPSGLNWSANRI